jgi:phosphatidylserine synthase
MCTLAATLLDEYLSKVAHSPRNEVGDQLALLNDLISFGIFTSLMLYQLIMSDAWYVQGVVALFFGVCVYKTALFASKKLPKTERFDIGLPLKSNAVSVLLLSFLSFLGNGFVIVCILLISAGIISSIKIPKLKI